MHRKTTKSGTSPKSKQHKKTKKAQKWLNLAFEKKMQKTQKRGKLETNRTMVDHKLNSKPDLSVCVRKKIEKKGGPKCKKSVKSYVNICI